MEIVLVIGIFVGVLNGVVLKFGLVFGSCVVVLDNLEWFWFKMGVLLGGGFIDWLVGFEVDMIV